MPRPKLPPSEKRIAFAFRFRQDEWDAIEKVSAEVYLKPSVWIRNTILQALSASNPQMADRGRYMTTAERCVELAVQGVETSEIAKTLLVSELTVQRHLREASRRGEVKLAFVKPAG